MFCKHIDLHNRVAMENYLRSHFFHKGYANDIVASLGLNPEEMNLLRKIDCLELIDDSVIGFIIDHTGQYTIIPAWLSPNVLVLHEAKMIRSPFRSECRTCNQKCVEEATEKSHDCYRCGATGDGGRVNKTFPMLLVAANPLYHEDDPSGWTLDDLRERFLLVQSFDQACDQVRHSFLQHIRRFQTPLTDNRPAGAI